MLDVQTVLRCKHLLQRRVKGSQVSTATKRNKAHSAIRYVGGKWYQRKKLDAICVEIQEFTLVTYQDTTVDLETCS